MSRICYLRVSTGDQSVEAQRKSLLTVPVSPRFYLMCVKGIASVSLRLTASGATHSMFSPRCGF
jgi:hypothetical protein